jgi:hypothetical protein
MILCFHNVTHCNPHCKVLQFGSNFQSWSLSSAKQNFSFLKFQINRSQRLPTTNHRAKNPSVAKRLCQIFTPFSLIFALFFYKIKTKINKNQITKPEFLKPNLLNQQTVLLLIAISHLFPKSKQHCVDRRFLQFRENI